MTQILDITCQDGSTIEVWRRRFGYHWCVVAPARREGYAIGSMGDALFLRWAIVDAAEKLAEILADEAKGAE